VLTFAVAPHNPDYERNRALLEDDDLEIASGELIETLARRYRFEDLLRQVFAQRREYAKLRGRGRAELGAGAPCYRLRMHLLDPGDWRAAPLSAADRESDLYRRHVVLVEAAAEPDPEPDEPEIVAAAPGWEAWPVVLGQLRLQLPQGAYDAWVRETSADLEGDRLTVRVTSETARQMLALRLRPLVESTVRWVAGRDLAVMFATEEDG
jgi:hypothetical protein